MKPRGEAKLLPQKSPLMDYPIENDQGKNGKIGPQEIKEERESEERIMSRDEGRKLGAKSQEGQKLTFAQNDGVANEAEKRGKVLTKVSLLMNYPTEKQPRQKRKNGPREKNKKMKIKKEL